MKIIKIEFDQIESITPPSFQMGITEYQIRRLKSSPCQLSFVVLLDEQPDHHKWQYVYDFSGNQYRAESFTPTADEELFNRKDSSIRAFVTLPNYDAEVSISIGPQKRFRDQLPWTTYKFKVAELVISSEEREACTHATTYTREGEVWGGASGSCQVEMETVCVLCRATLNTWYDHRN